MQANLKRARVAPNLWKNVRTGRFEDIRTYPGVGQKLTTLRATTLTEAKREQRALAVKVDTGESVVPSKITFATVADEHFDSFASLVASGERAERSLEEYKQRYRTHLQPRFGTMHAQKITAAHVARMLTEMRNSGLSPWTMKGAYALLGSIFEHALTRGYVSQSPLAKVAKKERPKGRAKTKARVLTNEEVGTLIDACGDHWKAMLSVAAGTGLRISELLGLRWQDVDRREGVIHVRFQLSRKSESGPAKLIALKSGAADRDVYLTPELEKLLVRYKLASGNSVDSDFVFGTMEGKPRSQRNAQRALTAAADKAKLNPEDLPPLSWHDLRHTAISRLIAAGLDVVTVQRQAGHARPSITLDTYSHEFEKANRSEDTRAKIAASGMDAVFAEGAS